VTEQVGNTDLERALADLGRQLAYPPTPDLSNAVRRHIAEQPAPRRPLWWLALRPRLALAVIALVLLVAGVLAFSPEARTAVAERLGLRGVQLTHLPDALPPTPVGAQLNLGRPLTLDEARAAVAFQVKLPAALGQPDEVYLLDTPPGGQVALVYAPRDNLPRAGTTGAGLLLTEFQASIGPGPPLGKGLPPGTRIEEVIIGATRGYWIDGDPHLFFFQDAQGRVQSESTRLAANVLVWQDGPLTLRLECALDKDSAVAIAASTSTTH
jgi:hypothetical protein